MAIDQAAPEPCDRIVRIQLDAMSIGIQCFFELASLPKLGPFLKPALRFKTRLIWLKDVDGKLIVSDRKYNRKRDE